MRECIAALVLVVLLFGAFVNLRHLDGLVEVIQTEIAESMAAYQAGQIQTADAKLTAALQQWMAAETYTNVFLRHPEIDAVTDAFYELSQRLNDGENAGLQASYELLLYHLTCIDQMEHPRLGSIL